MLCNFERTDQTHKLRCSRCGFSGEFGFAPAQVRRTCDVIDLHAEARSQQTRNLLSRGLVCRHLGAEVGLQECQGCRGRVQVKQFACHHPKHELTTLADCAECDDFAPQEVPHNQRLRLLIRFPHGFGDAVQFTIVLRHLRAHFPRWAISVAVKPGIRALFSGLVEEILLLDASSEGFDLERTLAWHEPCDCYADSAATKAEKCLREIFRIEPEQSLCRYHVCPDSQATRDAASFAERLHEQFPHKRGFVLVHYQGNSARRFKNIPEEVIASACQMISKSGYIPVLLDFDQRCRWRERGPNELVVLDSTHRLWRGRGIGDAGTIAALSDRATLCLGIDSGPGHVFAAGRTPTIITWTWHHPLHYIPPASHVTRLIPADHRQLLRGPNAVAGEAFFVQHYIFRRYHRLQLALPRLIEERLGKPSQPELAMHCDLWIRSNCSADKAEVERDYSQHVVPLSRRPKVVVDLAAGIGAFASALHQRSSRTRICCWSELPQCQPALQANVGSFAAMLPSIDDISAVSAAIETWLRSQPAPLDMLRFDSLSAPSCRIAEQILANVPCKSRDRITIIRLDEAASSNLADAKVD